MDEKILERLPYWQRLTADEKQLVRESARLRRFSKGQMLGGCGDECFGMTLLLSGEVRACLLSEEGREIALFTLRAGDPCVLTASCVIRQITFDTHMAVTADTELLIVNSGVFSRLTEQNIYVRCFMFELATERFSSVMWSMQQILFKGFDRRLAQFLVGEHERTGLDEIRMTHEQIARNTSSAREVVARMLKRFAADGLVEVRRGSIGLKNLEALRLMA